MHKYEVFGENPVPLTYAEAGSPLPYRLLTMRAPRSVIYPMYFNWLQGINYEGFGEAASSPARCKPLF